MLVPLVSDLLGKEQSQLQLATYIQSFVKISTKVYSKQSSSLLCWDINMHVMSQYCECRKTVLQFIIVLLYVYRLAKEGPLLTVCPPTNFFNFHTMTSKRVPCIWHMHSIANRDFPEVKDLHVVLQYNSTAINIDVHEWKGLQCSSTVCLLSTQTNK